MSHGQVRAGYWIDNILQGYSRYIGNQGEFYEGNLQNLKFTGLCKHINRLGKVRIGYFRENRPLGESRMFKYGKLEFYKIQKYYRKKY